MTRQPTPKPRPSRDRSPNAPARPRAHAPFHPTLLAAAACAPLLLLAPKAQGAFAIADFSTDGSGNFNAPAMTMWTGGGMVQPNVVHPEPTPNFQLLVDDASSGTLNLQFSPPLPGETLSSGNELNGDPSDLRPPNPNPLTVTADFMATDINGNPTTFDLLIRNRRLQIENLGDASVVMATFAFSALIAAKFTPNEGWGSTLGGQWEDGVNGTNQLEIDMQMHGLVTDPDRDGTFVTGDSGLNFFTGGFGTAYNGNGNFTGGRLQPSGGIIKSNELDANGDGVRNDTPADTAYFSGQMWTFTANTGLGLDGTFTDETFFRWSFDGAQYDNIDDALNPVAIPEPGRSLLAAIALATILTRRRRC